MVLLVSKELRMINSKMTKLEVTPQYFKIAKLIAWVFWVIFLFIFAYVFWRSEIFYAGNLRTGYFSFYLFAFSGVLFWGVVLRLQDKHRLCLVMLSMSFVAGLYFMESYLSFDRPLSSSISMAAKKSGVFFDTRSDLQIIQDLKEEGVDAVLNTHRRHFLDLSNESIFNLGGISEKTTVFDNESGEYPIIKMDRYGYNPDSVWGAKKTDAVLLGSSNTFGFGVKKGEDIASQIRSLTKRSIINLGSPNTGSLGQLSGLKEYAEARSPSVVLWMYYEENSLRHLGGEAKNKILRQYLWPDYSQDLMQKQKEIDAIRTKIASDIRADSVITSSNEEDSLFSFCCADMAELTIKLRLMHIRERLDLNIKESIGIELLHNDKDFEEEPLFFEILTKAKEHAATWGGKLVFVYLPSRNRYLRFFIDHDVYRKRAEILSKLKSLDIPVIDIHASVFKNHPDPKSLFPQHRHYTEEVHRLVANAIVREVDEFNRPGLSNY
jgi:hypothetical protein